MFGESKLNLVLVVAAGLVILVGWQHYFALHLFGGAWESGDAPRLSGL